ncbi:hypothetical protein KSS87_000221 [Heliosperma pusillum]|nr:hypothetical protein KSS87_000221 [Heliosperma pusillum]
MENHVEKVQKAHKAHVLILPYPAQGHINPMLQFAKRLVYKGIKPTLVTTVYLYKSMHTSTSPSGDGPQIGVRTISDGYDEGGRAQAESSEAYLASLYGVGPRNLSGLIKNLSEEGDPVKAVIYDGFFPWALDVAKEFGLFGVCFLTQSCAVNSVYYHVQRGLIQLPLSGPVNLPGVPELQPCDTPSFVYKYGSHPLWFNVVLGQFSNIDQADWVLTNIFYDMEKEAVDWMAKQWRIRTIGPTIPSHYLDKTLPNDKDYTHHLFKPNTTLCKTWLDTKPPGSVIYVSFGSGAEPPQEQYEELALGLKNSHYNFLWVVRDLEQHKLPKGFIEEVTSSGLGLVVSWASQLEVLAHEATACFVTHCGFNSVLEVLSIGVAVVAMPLWTDQGTNGKYLEDVWGVGIRVKIDEKGFVRSGELERCLKDVMKGSKRDEIMENVVKWKKLANEAVCQGGSSDRNIDEFVDYVLGRE